MKSYVADTVALAKYFEDRLPRSAERAFQEAERLEAKILVPEIVIGEFIYVALKGRLRVPDPSSTISELLEEMASSPFLEQSSMVPSSWKSFIESKAKELHDRMIYSIAVSSHASAILTNDKELVSSGFKTIW